MLVAARVVEAPLALKPELRHPDLGVGVPPGVVLSLILQEGEPDAFQVGTAVAAGPPLVPRGVDRVHSRAQAVTE